MIELHSTYKPITEYTPDWHFGVGVIIAIIGALIIGDFIGSKIIRWWVDRHYDPLEPEEHEKIDGQW